jgi:hypothetical protein
MNVKPTDSTAMETIHTCASTQDAKEPFPDMDFLAAGTFLTT